MKNQKYNYSLFVLVLLGFANSCYTLWHHLKINTEGLVSESFCNISSRINCDQAALSKYAFFFGIPTSAWALVFYSILASLALWRIISFQDNREEESKVSSGWFFTLSLIGLLPTFYLAGISAFVLNNLCIFCFISYILNISIAALAFFDFRKTSASLKTLNFKAPTWVWISMAFLISLSLFMPTVFKNSISSFRFDSKNIDQFVYNFMNQPQRELSYDNRPFIGNPDGKIVIVEFSDFQCPFCARSAQTLPLLLKEYKDIKLIFKNYPLNSECNPTINGAGHQLACIAAKTASCVFELKGNEAYYKTKITLFKKQTSLSRDLIEQTALDQGVSKDELAQCVSSIKTHERILEDVNEAKRIGVEGTPSIFVNGKFFSGATFPEVFKAAMNKLGAN